MRKSDPFATRAGMISLVIHAGFFFAAVIGAVASFHPPAAGLGGSPGCACMDVALVQLAQHNPPPAELPVIAPVAATPAPKPPETANTATVATADYSATPSGTEPITAVSTGSAVSTTSPSTVGSATNFGGVPVVARTVVFVIDRSASMGQFGRLDRAREQLAQCLRGLPATARFQVIAYHRQPEPIVIAGQRGLLPVTPTNVEAAVAALDRLIPEGGTDHVAAIRAAMALQPEVIYFLTDDDDLTADHVRELTRLNRGRSCIHTLCFVAPVGDSALPILAKQNRGTFKVFR